MSGFRYVLEARGPLAGRSGDVQHGLPPGMWKPDDAFLAASDLRQFRLSSSAIS